MEERLCMDCGEPMKLRTNKDGDEFYGCSAYPDCTYTENVDNEEVEGFDHEYIPNN